MKEKIEKAIDYNSHDFGEMGKFIRVEYVKNILARYLSPEVEEELEISELGKDLSKWASRPHQVSCQCPRCTPPQTTESKCCEKCREWKCAGQSMSSYSCYDINCPCHPSSSQHQENDGGGGQHYVGADTPQEGKFVEQKDDSVIRKNRITENWENEFEYRFKSLRTAMTANADDVKDFISQILKERGEKIKKIAEDVSHRADKYHPALAVITLMDLSDLLNSLK